MKYDGKLVMPESCAVMDQEEMTYVEGGWDYTYSTTNIAVPVKRSYMTKYVCSSFASYVINKHGSDGMVNGMDKTRVASELYAHALGYYGASTLIKLGVSSSEIKALQSSGKVADIGLGDGRDELYAKIWSVGLF